MRFYYVLGLLVCLFLLFQQSPLIAGTIPFAFWKKPSVCNITSNVTITSANVNAYSDCLWAIGASTTVTINYTSAIPIKGLTMTSTSTITHTGCNTTACTGMIYLNITGDVTMTSGARISADALGYLGSYQTGPNSVQNASTSGLTYNGGTGAGTTAGGSHGGWGGWNSAKTANIPNMPYGITKSPSTYGSGGGGLSAKVGGNGGGVIIMNISGNLTTNGNGTLAPISANGGNGTCGAGSGGSVTIAVAGTVTTTTSGGIITANGGTGGTTATCGTGNGSGGGGGGRVYLGYGGLGGTVGISNLQAFGGTGGSGAAYSGGSGTVVTYAVGASNGDLFINGSNFSTYKINGTPIGVFGRATSVSTSSIGFTSNYYSYTPGSFVGVNLVPDTDALTISQNAISSTTMSSIGIASGDLTTLTAVGRLWGIYDPGMNTYDNVTIAGASVVQSAVLVINGLLSIADTSTLMSATLYATTINMYNTASITPFPSDSNYFGRLKINATTMNISSSAKISADGMGYLGGGGAGLLGTNSSNYGMTVGFATTGAGSHNDTGGSHGSSGGYWADPSTKNDIPGVAYDSISQPSEAGGGGGTSVLANPGGTGGGVIFINLSGTLTLEGEITAKGNAGGGSGLAGGGGAGGSINITANTITSSGSSTGIDASGGSSTYNPGGAGGRIALTYNSLSGTMAISQAKITAAGGTGFDNGTQGGSGSVFTYPTGSTYGNFYFLDDTLSTFRSGLLSPYGFVSSSTSTTMTDSGLTTYSRDFFFTKAQVVGKTIAVGAEDTATTDFTITDYDATTGKFTVSGGNASTLVAGKMWYIKGFNTNYDNMYIYGDGKFDAPYLNVSGTFKGYASSNAYLRICRADIATLDLTNGAIILDAFQSTGPIPPKPLIINATTVTVGTSATINVSGSGYVGGNCTGNIVMGREGWCNNTSNTGYTYGNTTTGGSGSYSGGSHGGYGGKYTSSTPATPYGDATAPITFGSGGGGNSSVGTNGWGGSGGGVLIMNVSGTLTDNGIIEADGWPNDNGYGGSSAGGGGSIYVTAGTVSTNASGYKFSAGGGFMDGNSETVACGGGGGRIAIYYTTAAGSFSIGQLATIGGWGYGGSGCGNGGTEYMKKASDSGAALTVENGNQVPNYLPTPLPPTNLTLKTLYIQNAATAKMMANTYTYNFGSTGTLVVDSNATLYIPNDQSNVTPYNNAVPVGTWFTVPTARKTGNITEY